MTSGYTIVVRDGDGLKAIPYSVAYRQWLEPAAKLLERASAVTTNPSLKRFLSLRAKAFRTDDYYESELAWMDLKNTPIEGRDRSVRGLYRPAVRPEDRVRKLRDAQGPEESAALAKYKRISACDGGQSAGRRRVQEPVARYRIADRGCRANSRRRRQRTRRPDDRLQPAQ